MFPDFEIVLRADPRSDKQSRPSQQQFPKHNSIVMNFVVSRIHERDRALPREFFQLVELFRIRQDFRSITIAELLPAGGIVAKPFPQLGAGAMSLAH